MTAVPTLIDLVREPKLIETLPVWPDAPSVGPHIPPSVRKRGIGRGTHRAHGLATTCLQVDPGRLVLGVVGPIPICPAPTRAGTVHCPFFAAAGGRPLSLC
jgi:hypothetical protein